MASPGTTSGSRGISMGGEDRSRKLGAILDQLFRYAFNCGIVLTIKLALSWLLLLALVPAVAYLVVHIATFFVSYAIHARATFGVEYSWSHVRKYFSAVIGFKLLDYLVFTVLFAAMGIEALLSVLLASIAVMLLRFAVVRKILKKPADHGATGSEPCTNS